MTNRGLYWCAVLTTLGFAALLAWRAWSPEAKKLKKLPTTTHTHTHTVTFTCSRTCTDLTLVPEVFPWK